MGSPAKAVTVGCALVVSDSSAIIEQLNKAFAQLAIATEVCRDPAAAIRLLNRRKFEAVFIDIDSFEKTEGVLEEIRHSPSNRSAVTFATRDSSAAGATFAPTAMFVMERPLSADALDRFLRAAYGMIVRERRRYFRCPISLPAKLRLPGDLEDVACTIINISEGGLALSVPMRLRPGAHLTLRFTLPTQWVECDARAEVSWSDDSGRVGMKFVLLSSQQQFRLQHWIARKLEETLPFEVVQRLKKDIEF